MKIQPLLELQRLKKLYSELGELAERDKDLFAATHSIEEAKKTQEDKREMSHHR